MLIPFIAALIGFASLQPAPLNLVLLFDGGSLSTPSRNRVSKADEALFKQQILPAAKRHWRGKSGGCDKDDSMNFQIVDAARGPFTRPDAKQEAILYRYCSTGHNFALDGLAIVENGRVVTHFAYEGAWDIGIIALPDINGNGLSEILISTGGTNMGETWEVVSIIEINGRTMKRYGSAQVLSDRCGVSAKDGGESYKLYARMGKAPVFFHETFRESCRRNAVRRKAGSLKQIALDGDTSVYQYIG